jgi:hypothetical protein
VFLGRSNYRHALRVPLEEHLLVRSSPRMLKTVFQADVILRDPCPVIAASTKPDIYPLPAAVRAALGPVHVFNQQHIDGCETRYRRAAVPPCRRAAAPPCRRRRAQKGRILSRTCAYGGEGSAAGIAVMM